MTCTTRLLAPFAAVALAVGGCSPTESEDDSSDVSVDTGAADTGGTGDVAATDAPDVDEAPVCPGEPGCPCKTAVDCDFPKCIATPDGSECARKCVDSCPAGFSCKTGSGDGLSVCVPSWGLLCRPCDATQDCTLSGAAKTWCVDYAGAGGFCGSFCEASADCPANYVCKIVETVDAGKRKQCVREEVGKEFGTCPCSKAATAGALATTCWIPTKDKAATVVGKCKGQRLCAEKGLTACEKLTGKQEDCRDIQCDEKPDGLKCTDGDKCTDGEKCKGGVCTGGTNICECQKNADCADPDDNPCTGVPYCDTATNACKNNPATVINCSKAGDTACRANACDPKTLKCAYKNASTSTTCDDGKPCTSGDSCDGKGACLSGTNTCECQVTADCATKEDGDLCNGTLYCDKVTLPYACTVNLATRVFCDKSGDSSCVTAVCNGKDGSCFKQASKDTTACEDGSTCTKNDACKGGTCVGGLGVCPCTKHSDCVAKDDGNVCNGTMYCNKAAGTCQVNPATVVSCPSVKDSYCQRNVCDPKTGACKVLPQNENNVCYDNDGCTVSTVCMSGTCRGGQNLCSCKTNADCAGKDGGDKCIGTYYCAKAKAGAANQKSTCKLNPVTAVTCPTVDNTACAVSTCVPKTGKCAMKPINETGVCDADGTACTPKDTCEKGVCVADANLCACTKEADCAGKSAGNLCDGSFYCDKSATDPKKWSCVPNQKTKVSCKQDPTKPCIVSTCDPLTGGCTDKVRGDGSACDDGDPCTSGDLCKKAQCLAGAAVCGCEKDSDCSKFDDGDKCNGMQSCDAKKKVCGVAPASIVTCKDDGTPCTAVACDKKTGTCATGPILEGKICKAAPSKCQAASLCKSGVCKVGATTVCDDKDPCTIDACNGATGKCAFTKKPGCCLADKDCPAAGTCTTGKCVSGKCAIAALPGKCDDGNKCTLTGDCDNTTCKKGPAKDCKDAISCTLDSCDAKTGSCVHQLNHKPCDDGVACTTGHKCDPKTGCKVGVKQDGLCDDKDDCTDDTCTAKGCTNGAAKDGTTCGSGGQRVCKSGKCETAKKSCKSDKDCDDDDACTEDNCENTAKCSNEPIGACGVKACTKDKDCADSGNCLVGSCLGKVCTVKPRKCDDGNVCTVDTCTEKSGCKDPTFVATECQLQNVNACQQYGSCSNGTCKTAPNRYKATPWYGDFNVANVTTSFATAMNDGSTDLAITGKRFVGNKQEVYVARVSALAKQLWQTNMADTAANNGTISFLSTAHQGTIGAAGTTPTSGGVLQVLLAVFDARTGTRLASNVVKTATWPIAMGALVDEDDLGQERSELHGYGVIGQHPKAGSDLHWLRFSRNGRLLGSGSLTNSKPYKRYEKAVVRHSGDTILAGVPDGPPTTKVDIAGLHLLGGVSWQVQVDMPTGLEARNVTAIGATAEGRALIAVAGETSKTHQPYGAVMTIDADGRMMTNLTNVITPISRVTTIVPRTNGGWLLGGTNDMKMAAYLVAMQGTANRHFELKSATMPLVASVIEHVSGDVIGVITSGGPKPVASVIRVDGYLNASDCSSDTTCSSSNGKCDDSKPCTFDTCSSGKCKWSIANALTCDDGNACTVGTQCGAGKCASFGEPAFATKAWTPATFEPLAIAPLQAGGYAVVGHDVESNSDRGAIVYGHDNTGKLLSAKPARFDTAGNDFFFDAVASPPGGLLAVGRIGVGNARAVIAQIDPAVSGIVWSKYYGSATSYFRRIVKAAGGFVAVGDDSTQDIRIRHIRPDGASLSTWKLSTSCKDPFVTGADVAGGVLHYTYTCSKTVPIVRYCRLPIGTGTGKCVDFGKSSGADHRLLGGPVLAKSDGTAIVALTSANKGALAERLAAYDTKLVLKAGGVVTQGRRSVALVRDYNSMLFVLGMSNPALVNSEPFIVRPAKATDVGKTLRFAPGWLAAGTREHAGSEPRDMARLADGRLATLWHDVGKDGYRVRVYDGALQEKCTTTSKCPNKSPNLCAPGVCDFSFCDPGAGCKKAPKAVFCDDQNPCTADSCSSKTGCSFVPITTASPCALQNGAAGACQLGKCRFAASVAAGGQNRCALSGSGRLACWGQNNAKQLGTGVAAVTEPKVLAQQGVVEVDPSHEATFFRRNDGMVLAVGSLYAQRGNGTSSLLQNLSPKLLGAWGKVDALAATNRTLCAIVSGDVKCAGSNLDGQIGNNASGSIVKSPSKVTIPNGLKATAIAAGPKTFCVILANKQVACWGKNNTQQAGMNLSNVALKTPRINTELKDPAAEIALGSGHTCVRTAAGKLYCWGKNSARQVDAGTASSFKATHPVPHLVTGVPVVRHIALADDTTCFLDYAGDVYCYGSGEEGALGNGATKASTNPVRVMLPGPADDIACTPDSDGCCAALQDGGVFCWGQAYYGELGNGAQKDGQFPAQVITAIK